MKERKTVNQRSRSSVPFFVFAMVTCSLLVVIGVLTGTLPVMLITSAIVSVASMFAGWLTLRRHRNETSVEKEPKPKK